MGNPGLAGQRGHWLAAPLIGKLCLGYISRNLGIGGFYKKSSRDWKHLSTAGVTGLTIGMATVFRNGIFQPKQGSKTTHHSTYGRQATRELTSQLLKAPPWQHCCAGNPWLWQKSPKYSINPISVKNGKWNLNVFSA